MDESILDKRSLRHAFERAAATYDAAAVLQNEVCRRMLERLDYIRHRPDLILDAGSGTGNALSGLRQRYPRAVLLALDIAVAMLARGRRATPWWKGFLSPAVYRVCGDIERLPVAGERVGMVWSNLALQWTNEPQRVFAEMRRVLVPGGLVMFSTFGPDTLRELRAAYGETDRYTHVNRFSDLHDLGDLLVAAGFADPVMDMEYFTLTYDDVRHLMRELKAIGAHNVTRGRPPALSGKRRLAAVCANYERFRRDGKLPATFEVVYGHAWKPQRRTGPDGRPVIEIRPH
jgi:malonyl-CoA O-methyltransferase